MGNLFGPKSLLTRDLRRLGRPPCHFGRLNGGGAGIRTLFHTSSHKGLSHMSIPVHPRRVGKGWQIIPPDAFAPTTDSLPPQESRTLALMWGEAHSVGTLPLPRKSLEPLRCLMGCSSPYMAFATIFHWKQSAQGLVSLKGLIRSQMIQVGVRLVKFSVKFASHNAQTLNLCVAPVYMEIILQHEGTPATLQRSRQR